jgi:hypothetical protein
MATLALTLRSASGVATTVAAGGCGVVVGAVYLPLSSMLPAPPAITDHETLVLVDPVTVAVNVGAEQVRTFAGLGDTVIVTGPGAGESTGASGPASTVGLGAGVALDESSQPKAVALAAAASRSAPAHPMMLRMVN